MIMHLVLELLSPALEILVEEKPEDMMNSPFLSLPLNQKALEVQNQFPILLTLSLFLSLYFYKLYTSHVVVKNLVITNNAAHRINIYKIVYPYYPITLLGNKRHQPYFFRILCDSLFHFLFSNFFFLRLKINHITLIDKVVIISLIYRFSTKNIFSYI